MINKLQTYWVHLKIYHYCFLGFFVFLFFCFLFCFVWGFFFLWICGGHYYSISIEKMKENGFKLIQERNGIYIAHKITDADYDDDIALLENTPVQTETLLHCLKRAAAAIGLHINAVKTEYMCFNQRSDISTINGSSLKLVDKFTYLGISVSSTETEIDMRLAKTWTVTDSLSVIWKCSSCNGYRRRKWTRRHEFKSWTRLIAFHIALIPLGKVWIQLFSLQLWVNSRTD